MRIKGEYTPSGSAAKKKKKWEYLEAMEFLKDTINYRTTTSNLQLSVQVTPSVVTPQSPLSSISEPQGTPICRETKRSNNRIEGATVETLNQNQLTTCGN